MDMVSLLYCKKSVNAKIGQRVKFFNANGSTSITPVAITSIPSRHLKKYKMQNKLQSRRDTF